MTRRGPGNKQTPSLGEDWIAVVIGLGLVALVWLGAISNVAWPLFGFLK